MASKIVKKVKIPLKSGSKASGKTVPSPGSVRGGGTLSTVKGGGTGAFGLLSGAMGRKGR